MKQFILSMVFVAGLAAPGWAQFRQKTDNAQSPSTDTTVMIAGKAISVEYSAPSARGRKIFGPDGLQPDGTVWRAGADNATTFHTYADLAMSGTRVPKGTYTLYIFLDPAGWKLAVNKQTGQWGTEYHQAQDLARIPMKMSRPSMLVETLQIVLSKEEGNHGELKIEWADKVATVPFTVIPAGKLTK